MFLSFDFIEAMIQLHITMYNKVKRDYVPWEMRRINRKKKDKENIDMKTKAEKNIIKKY
jgi:hypothetical protein